MNPFRILVLSCFAVGASFAEEFVARDKFESDTLSKNWAVAKGKWEIIDGRLKGAELAADEHAAVATYKSPHTDSKVGVSFQLDGSSGFHLSYNKTRGHLFRVIVSDNSVRINLDKDKKDPASKPVVLARKKASFESGKMYTLTCETSGDTVKVRVGEVELEGNHEKLATAKTGYRLVLKGEGVLFDNFIVHSQG